MNNYQKALDPNASPEDRLRTFATDENSYVRCWVARHPKTPEDALRTLATDDHSSVRYHAAHHPNATEIVRRLFLMTNSKLQTSTK